jgi:8-oxo-dGTP diphosphatase
MGTSDDSAATGDGAVGRVCPARRSVHFHDPAAPQASAVVPSVFVAVRGPDARLLMVRRCDSGSWELPGGRVDVGENALTTAQRETAEESGVRVQVTGLVGLYTDPGYIVRAVDGAVRQQFVVVFHAIALGGSPRADRREISEARWASPRTIAGLPVERGVRGWIADALRADASPHLG